eukprot:6465953-Amphidinium_carterae.1
MCTVIQSQESGADVCIAHGPGNHQKTIGNHAIMRVQRSQRKTVCGITPSESGASAKQGCCAVLPANW